VTWKRKNWKTGALEAVTANLASMFQIAQVRGAISALLQSCGFEVYSLVESTLKKSFTGDGRADKEKILTFARAQWPDIPTDYDLADGVMCAEVLRCRWKFLEAERKAR
jgi:Holliday junction resolvasome RuvABC endonuclease subunit